jgi:hypothetical protein
MLRRRRCRLTNLVVLVACVVFAAGAALAQQPVQRQPTGEDGGQPGDGYTVKKTKPAPQSEPPQAPPSVPPQPSPPPTASQPKPRTPQPAQSGAAQEVPPVGEPVRVQTGQPAPTQVAPAPAPRTITERVLKNKFGDVYQSLVNQAAQDPKDRAGMGAPSADRWFDGAGQRAPSEPELAPSGTRFFPQGTGGQGQPGGSGAQSVGGGGVSSSGGVQAQPSLADPRLPSGVQLQQSPPIRIQRVEPPSPVIGGGSAAGGAPAVKGAYKPATTQDIKGVKENYGGIPGGVVLEGVAIGLGRVEHVAYDPRFNAIALDDRAVYFTKVPARTLAVMCRAIAQDERVGVSLGRKHIVYGKVPESSDLAVDLKLADHFLGDIVFAEGDWTSGYRFPNGFRPQPNRDDTGHVAVFFNFNGFEFAIQQEEIRMTAASFDVRLVPLTEQADEKGAHQPDLDAVAKGSISRQYEANARHIAENIGYYQKERIISRTFAYGEAAAFVRGLKRAGVDLSALANTIDAAVR